MKLGLEDWEFLLRLLNENSHVYQLNESFFFYRIKKQSMVKQLANNTEYLMSLKEKIYKLHAGVMVKYHGDWINLINSNKTLMEQKEKYQNYIPKRSLKNVVKFLLGKKLFFNANQK